MYDTAVLQFCCYFFGTHHGCFCRAIICEMFRVCVTLTCRRFIILLCGDERTKGRSRDLAFLDAIIPRFFFFSYSVAQARESVADGGG